MLVKILSSDIFVIYILFSTFGINILQFLFLKKMFNRDTF